MANFASKCPKKENLTKNENFCLGIYMKVKKKTKKEKYFLCSVKKCIFILLLNDLILQHIP